MNKAGFIRRYPGLSGYFAGEFQYPDDRTDEKLASDISQNLPDKDRRVILPVLVQEGNHLLLTLDDSWEALSDTVNREFHDAAAAREWLIKVLAVWEGDLSKLNGSKPS